MIVVKSVYDRVDQERERGREGARVDAASVSVERCGAVR